MPRRKTAEPLYRLCVRYVAGRIEALCQPHDAVASAFPPAVNEDLMDALQSDQQSSNFGPLLHHLLSHRLRRVKLRFDHDWAPKWWLPLLLGRVCLHGQQLAELSLVGVRQDDGPLVGLLCRLPRLRRLTLRLCSVTDRVVVAIADHCGELRELALSGERVTDDSLYLLVACTKLRTLQFQRNFYPLFTVASTLQLLRGLRHLSVLRCPFLTDALVAFPAGCSPLPLTDYTVCNPLYRPDEALLHVVSVCPQLTRVDLSLVGQESLRALAELQALSELTLRAVMDSTEHFFCLQVEPVLRAVGRHLCTLSLSLQYVDVAAISRHCPALMKLEVDDLRALIVTDQPPVSFRKLEHLRFVPRPVNAVTPEQLFGILRRCGQLLWASLGFCRLTDAFLGKLVESGTFGKLRTLELSSVGSVTGLGLRALVMADSALALLIIFGCNGVRRADIEHLENHVADNNLDLSIKYCEV